MFSTPSNHTALNRIPFLSSHHLTLSPVLQKLPPKRPNLPTELFSTKELPPDGEEEEEEEEEEEGAEKNKHDASISNMDCEESSASTSEDSAASGLQILPREVKGKMT